MVGVSDVVDDTVRGIVSLEYRGYDSYGLSVLRDDALHIVKDVGSVSLAAERRAFDAVGTSPVAIAHTRWATHGSVSQRNAHPHVSADGRTAVAHNGVIENHHELRRLLVREGVTFSSETDTEVIAHLVARHVALGGSLLDAVAATVPMLEGEYAFVVMSAADPGRICGARRKSPLAVGWTDDRAVVASDQLAIGLTCDRGMYLLDGDVVVVEPGSARIYTVGPDGVVPAQRECVRIESKADQITMNGYSHFMEKETHEAPDAVRTVLRLPAELMRDGLGPEPDAQVNVTGAGSSFFVAQLAQYVFAKLARTYVIAHPSDEIANVRDFGPRDWLVGISQSGETYDTLEVARIARARGAGVTSITNVRGSSLDRVADVCIHQGSGAEVCVLSTKSIVAQVAICIRLAMERGLLNGSLTEREFQRLSASLERLPDTLGTILTELAPRIREVGERYNFIEHWFFIGRGLCYPVALESALKFKEVSYIHAEGMPAGFFKHGTISLIDDGFYTIAFLPSRVAEAELFKVTLANISEIAARGGRVLAFGPAGATEDELEGISEYVPLPYHDDVTDSIQLLVAGQLLAYHCAVSLGREIDKPRALAKSVTVR
jgi:glucosamine--fructose-6-phosphate aminotransferase (isomerizing)